MEEELLFRVLFLSVYTLFASVRIRYRGKNIGRKSEKRNEGVGKAGIALALAILGYFASVALYLLFPDLIGWAHISLPTPVRWAGLGLALAGVLLIFITHHTIGEMYSARQEIQKKHVLITKGIYSRVRHPMYTSMNLFALAVSLMSSNILLMVFALLVALPFPWIARKEERMLLDRFGNEYKKYMKTTGRFFPRIRKRREEDPNIR